MKKLVTMIVLCLSLVAFAEGPKQTQNNEEAKQIEAVKTEATRHLGEMSQECKNEVEEAQQAMKRLMVNGKVDQEQAEMLRKQTRDNVQSRIQELPEATRARVEECVKSLEQNQEKKAIEFKQMQSRK